MDTGCQGAACVTLEVEDGRRGWLDVREAANMWEVFPWAFGFRAGDRYITGTIADYDGFYSNLMRQSMQFCRTGESPVSVREMLDVVAILEAAPRSRTAGEWLPVGR